MLARVWKPAAPAFSAVNIVTVPTSLAFAVGLQSPPVWPPLSVSSNSCEREAIAHSWIGAPGSGMFPLALGTRSTCVTLSASQGIWGTGRGWRGSGALPSPPLPPGIAPAYTQACSELELLCTHCDPLALRLSAPELSLSTQVNPHSLRHSNSEVTFPKEQWSPQESPTREALMLLPAPTARPFPPTSLSCVAQLPTAMKT